MNEEQPQTQNLNSNSHHHHHHPEELHRTSSSIRRQPPPRPPTTATTTTTTTNVQQPEQQQQQQEPVLPLPPRVPLKPTVLHAVNVTATAQPSQSPVQGTAPLVPLQQQQQQQPSITFGRRSRTSPVQPSLSSASRAAASSPSPSRTFINSHHPIRGASPTTPTTQQQQPTPILSLTRNITNLSSNLISTLVSSGQSPAAQDAVTLAEPRPENARLTNEYVDTPFLQRGQGTTPVTLHAANAQQHQQHSTTTPQLSLRQNSNPHHHHHHLLSSSRTSAGPVVVTSQPTAASGHGPTARLLSDSGTAAAAGAGLGSPNGTRKQLLTRHASDASQVITKQPQKALAKKDLDTALHSIDKLDRAEFSTHLIDGGVMGAPAPGHAALTAGLTANGQPSITCPVCERCRCEGCQRPRQLPSRWLCGKSCLCSAESVLDYATCLCCVKALFYHCSKDHEIDNENGNSISCADDPCSCLPHRRTTRWGCLGALSIFLPCLACYWPMRGCISLCASCYASHSRKGCRCDQKAVVGRSGAQQMPLRHQQFGRDGPMRASTGRGGGGNGTSGGNGGVFPGAAKKVFPAEEKHHHHQEVARKNKLAEESGKHVDCDMAEEQDRLTVEGGVLVVGGRTNSAVVDSDSSSSCGSGGQNLVRTLRLKPNSTSSTSSSQLSLLRHPADETPPRHLLD